MMTNFAGEMAGTNVIDPADLPVSPAYPNRAVILAIGLVGGLTLGLAGFSCGAGDSVVQQPPV